MTTPTPCKRHKGGAVTKWRVIGNDEHTHWVVAEFRNCSRCGDAMNGRIARGTIRKDQRDTLAAYGCTAEEAEAYIRTYFPELALQPQVEVSASTIKVPPLTEWPFPCSTWLHDYPRPQQLESTR